MSELVKCEGIDCKRKESCERFVSEPLPRYQAYLCMPVACKNPNDGCKWFVDNGEKQ